MIFEHRKNTTPVTTFDGIEFDLRHYGTGLCVSHDPVPGTDIDTYMKYVNLNTALIVNSKESGVEDKFIKMHPCCDYYFLDSQIPDIVRLTKTAGIGERFILRVSDLEPFNEPLYNFTRSKYVWFDWNNWLDLDSYFEKLSDLVQKSNEYGFKIILVSPELYGYQNIDIAYTISEFIPSGLSVCTKIPKVYETKC